MLNTIPLGYFRGDHDGHCGYCDSQNSHSLGFVSELLSPKVYFQMMNRGWRRCGTYWYKPNIQESCCMSYTIRQDTREYVTMKKNHRKIAKRFMAFLNWPGLNNKVNFLINCISIQDKKLEQIVKEFQQEYEKSKKQQKESVDEEQKDPQHEKQKGKQEIKKQKNKMQIEQIEQIPAEIENDIKGMTNLVIQELRNQKGKYISLFKEFFLTQGFSDNASLNECFVIQEVNPKIFKSKVPEKGDYYTNFLMLLYGQNKKTLFQKLSLIQFVDYTKEWFRNIFSQFEQYLINIEPNGYVSFFTKDKEKQYQKRQQKIEQLQQKEDNQNKQTKQKELPKMISDQNFSSNSFKIGNMQVVLKKAACEKDGWDIYKRYCKTVHGKQEKSESSYKSFLCENSLKTDLTKSPIDSKSLLFKGCYHMNYYINDQLVGIGVIDLFDQGMSSVYFFFEPSLHELNFGIFGALIEIEYIKKMNSLFPDFYYYYMGFYIQSTNKMVYKGDFEPSQLLCPLTYTWVYLDDQLRKEIDKRMKETNPKKRKLRLSSDETKVIDDMNFDCVFLYCFISLKLNKLEFYEQNAVFYIVKQKQEAKYNQLSEFFRIQVLPYLDNTLSTLGKEMFKLQIKLQV